MAKEDDDWNNFMASIDEPDEEVETEELDPSEDEPKKGDEEDPDPKPKKKSKETAKVAKVDEEEDPDEGDPDEEDPDDEDPAAGKPKAGTYTPRLKQFLNDDGTLDPERIEKSYIANSKETVRINGLLEEEREKNTRLIDAIKAKPEAAKLLFGEEGAKDLTKATAASQEPKDPISAHIQAQLNKQNKREYNDFVEAHPEAVTDPEKVQRIGKFLKRFGPQYAEDNDGELPSMKVALEAAYRYLGYDLGVTKEERIANAAKKTAATKRTPSKKGPVVKQKKNQLEGFFANKLGVTLAKS